MERVTRSSKVSDEALQVNLAPAKRGRKKKNNNLSNEQETKNLQSTRRSLRNKNVEINPENSSIELSSSNDLELEISSCSNDVTIESEIKNDDNFEEEIQEAGENIKELEGSMSRCELIDGNKYPVVVLHQLGEIAPKIESPAIIDKFPEVSEDVEAKKEEDMSIKEDEQGDNKEEKMETQTALETSIQHDENNTTTSNAILSYDENVSFDIQDSTLRRSRRLKSIFQESSCAIIDNLPQQQPMEVKNEEISEPPNEISVIDQKESVIKQETEPKEEEKREEVSLIKIEPESNEISIDPENDERLKQLVTIKENIYLKPSDKVICKINKTMKCDCTITEADIKNGELGCTYNCINRLLFIECSPKCRCGEFCDNQQFQRFNYAPISVFKTEKKGYGIRADADIPPETFIIEYVGEVLNNKQFEKRANKYSKDKNRHYYFMALRSNAVIDATVKGNISRFINHSCDPNAMTQKWTINGELRVGFFSVRLIKKGEEITFDYQFQRYGKEAQKCYCESENCRGWIGEPDSENEAETIKDKKSFKSKKVPSSKTKSKLKVIENEDEEITTAVEDEEESNDKAMAINKKSQTSAKKTKKLYEDIEIEEQIRDLTKSGLKNRAHTIALARLVVRAKSIESRSSLLKILIAGELPCKRLFLDYNGLKLLHNWMCDVSIKNSIPDLYLCLELLNALSVLPITNKTILKDSKVLERVEKWKNLTIERKKLTKEEKKQAKADKKKKNKLKIHEDQNVNEIKEDNFQVTISLTFDVLEELPTMKLTVKDMAASLLQKWEVLKEDFRIPKKQKQENRKEHEMEAGMEEDLWNDQPQKLKLPSMMMNDRAKNRFGPNETGGYKSSSYNSQVPTATSSTSYRNSRYLDPLERQYRRQQFQKRVEQIELEKRIMMEHESNCAIFGLPVDTPPTLIPVKVNRVTGEYYQIFGNKVPRPPNHQEFKYEPLTLSTNPDDYHLPSIDLPEHWRFAIDKFGQIYYYHEKIRISQWEAPIKILPLFSAEEDEDSSEIIGNLETSDEDESSTDTVDSEEDELRELLVLLRKKKRKIDQKGFDEHAADDININVVEQDLDKKIKQNSGIDNPVKIERANVDSSVKRKKKRRLVTMMKYIKPRTEEDKINGRMESRRYKEVKERLRRKKKKRLQEGNDANNSDDDEDYDEDEATDAASFSGRMVDELDILKKTKHLDKFRKIKGDLDAPTSFDVARSNNNKPSSRPITPNDQSLIKRQFRDDIKEEIAKYLLPYRNESCTNGRIVTDEDYVSLINKLTFSVLTKESKHCAQSNSMLKATDSVKGKTKEFIKKYMSKFAGTYQRKADEQDYSLILNKY